METISSFLTDMLSSGQGMTLGHILLSVLIAYLGGIFSSLTPCVYPMVPITISVIGGIGTTRRPLREIALRASSYVAGMTLVYSFLGVLAGLTGRVFGTLTNTSYWYAGIGILMSIAALFMLDVFHFDPQVWINRLRGNKRLSSSKTKLLEEEMTLLGTFILGATSGFIAAPCTTPVLTSILAFIASSKSVALGFFLMMSFSLGLGTILLLIAFFAGAVRFMPRSGSWMVTIKKFSGLILLAFGEYLIYRAGCAGGP